MDWLWAEATDFRLPLFSGYVQDGAAYTGTSHVGSSGGRFPVDVQGQTRVKVGFYRLFGLPQVLGAVDGTLIPIIAPKEHEEAFVCRKGFHALNVQGIVDSELRFLNVVSTYPGSTHDAFMFVGCGVKDYLERNDVGYLLGDSGYTLRRYMTPLATPNNAQQTRFNIAHKRGRVVVERAFGVLKSRFRCLHKTGCLPFTPSECARIVLACMHLHNFCMDRNIVDPTLMPDGDNDDEDDAIDRPADGVDGTEIGNVIERM